MSEEFLCRFGDVIDDRIAEILDERAAAPPAPRLAHIVVTVGLILALAASVLLRHSPLAAWIIWPSAATIYLAMSRPASTRRS